MAAFFSDLGATGIIAARGPDAAAFLHAQLTSDIAALTAPRTQYSGYCSPKGRLIATFLVWRREDDFLLQIPQALRDAVQARLSKYVLRARVALTSPDVRLFGVWGGQADRALERLVDGPPARDHEVVGSGGLCITRLPVERYLVAADGDHADRVRAVLRTAAQEEPESAWAALDIASGVPVITRETQEQYVPQMVNLDLIGGVSYTKGCYPGQEIVARTHYLGRLKQRMYRVRVPGGDAAVGDPLYSDAFGADQASGALLNVAPLADGAHDALAVIQTAAIGRVRWKSLAGTVVELADLPYPVTEGA